MGQIVEVRSGDGTAVVLAVGAVEPEDPHLADVVVGR
jgi:hypothetical protein